MAFVYILFSKTLDRFYVGSTSDVPENRLKKHLTNHDGYTAKAKDWLIAYVEEFESLQQARLRERVIKSWKSRKKILEMLNVSPFVGLAGSGIPT